MQVEDREDQSGMWVIIVLESWDGMGQFRINLAGEQFVVLMDNNTLVQLKTTKIRAVESRWLGDLNQFDWWSTGLINVFNKFALAFLTKSESYY